MSGPQTPEPALDRQGDCSTGSGDEGAADGIQHSHRMLSFSDALLSIIATVMVRVGPRPWRAAEGWEEQPRTGPRPRATEARPCPARDVSFGSCCFCSRSCP